MKEQLQREDSTSQCLRKRNCLPAVMQHLLHLGSAVSSLMTLTDAHKSLWLIDPRLLLTFSRLNGLIATQNDTAWGVCVLVIPIIEQGNLTPVNLGVNFLISQNFYIRSMGRVLVRHNLTDVFFYSESKTYVLFKRQIIFNDGGWDIMPAVSGQAAQ